MKYLILSLIVSFSLNVLATTDDLPYDQEGIITEMSESEIDYLTWQDIDDLYHSEETNISDYFTSLDALKELCKSYYDLKRIPKSGILETILLPSSVLSPSLQMYAV